MKLIHKGLNIEQLLNFSLLHNDYVIWLNNVHRVKTEKNLCTKNSLLGSNVTQTHHETSLVQAHNFGSEIPAVN